MKNREVIKHTIGSALYACTICREYYPLSALISDKDGKIMVCPGCILMDIFSDMKIISDYLVEIYAKRIGISIQHAKMLLREMDYSHEANGWVRQS